MGKGKKVMTHAYFQASKSTVGKARSNVLHLLGATERTGSNIKTAAQ